MYFIAGVLVFLLDAWKLFLPPCCVLFFVFVVSFFYSCFIPFVPRLDAFPILTRPCPCHVLFCGFPLVFVPLVPLANSCSEDGTVVVTGLRPTAGGEQPPPEVYSYGAKWPMLAVRLDPLYSRRWMHESVLLFIRIVLTLRYYWCPVAEFSDGF